MSTAKTRCGWVGMASDTPSRVGCILPEGHEGHHKFSDGSGGGPTHYVNVFLSNGIQTALVFAARYTHRRSTTGASCVIDTINSNWHQLDDHTQRQLVRESYEATECKDMWDEFRQAHPEAKA